MSKKLKFKEKESVSGPQHFPAIMKDGKLLLSGSQNFVLPLFDNADLCAKWQVSMYENVFEELRKYLLQPIQSLDILCFSFLCEMEYAESTKRIILPRI